MRLICLICIAFFFAACTAPRNAAGPGDWKLSWSDEFNYNGLPDNTKWDYDTGGHGWGNNELQYYTRASLDNAEVSNGSLKLKAIQQKKENRDYTSARMITRGKADFTYGKIEIRAKLPPGVGLWPAIWMLGSNVDKVGWPECGEIDIMEHVGYEKDSVLATVHTKAYNHIIGTQKTKKLFITDPYKTYHVYSVEWTPEHMDFYCDNILYNHVLNEHKTTAEWPFDAPFYLVLDIAIGGNLGGKKGVDKNIFPAAMEVDYIRIYKQDKS